MSFESSMAPDEPIPATQIRLGGREAGVAQPKKVRTQAAERRALLYPGLIVVGVVTQLPFLLTIYLSLVSWNLVRPDLGIHFVGLANYRDQIFSPTFAQVLWQTIALTAMALIICCVVGLGLALLLNRDFPAKGLIQTLLVTPFFIMPTVTGLIWKNELFNPTIGVITYYLNAIGLRTDLLAQHPLFMIATMAAWEWEPLFMLVLLAGLQAISEEEIEAAHLDGGGRIATFRYIQLPHLRPYFRISILLGTIFILQVFGEIYVSTAGGPGTSSMNLPFLIYQTGLVGWQVGAAAALGIATVIVTLIVATGLARLLRGAEEVG